MSDRNGRLIFSPSSLAQVLQFSRITTFCILRLRVIQSADSFPPFSTSVVKSLTLTCKSPNFLLVCLCSTLFRSVSSVESHEVNNIDDWAMHAFSRTPTSAHAVSVLRDWRRAHAVGILLPYNIIHFDVKMIPSATVHTGSVARVPLRNVRSRTFYCLVLDKETMR